MVAAGQGEDRPVATERHVLRVTVPGRSRAPIAGTERLARRSRLRGNYVTGRVNNVRSLGSSVGYSSGRAVPVPCRADEIRVPVTSSLRTAGAPATRAGD